MRSGKGIRGSKVLITSAAAMLIAVAAAWYLESPWWTLWQMREAALTGDVKRLASYIDFGAVARNHIVEPGWKSIIAEFAKGGATKREAREYASQLLYAPRPDTLAGTASLSEGLTDISLRQRDLIGGPLGFSPLIKHRGLNEFVVRNSSTPSPVTLTFRRHGLGWKLEAIRWGFPD